MSERIRPMYDNAHLTIDAQGHITIEGWYFHGHIGSHTEVVLRLVLWALDKAYVHQDPISEEPKPCHDSKWKLLRSLDDLLRSRLFGTRL